jgi:hypothetical protein
METILQFDNVIKNPIEQFKRCDATTSEKYAFFSTQSIINKVESYGLTLVDQNAVKPRSLDRIGYTKHLLKFNTGLTVGGNELQLLVTNAHDGTSSLKFNIGVFRLACSNGLVVGDSFYTERIVHHNKNIPRVDEVLRELPEKLRIVASMVTKMKETKLIRHDMYRLCGKVCELRGFKGKVSYLELLKPLRGADMGEDLYTIYNILQEKMMHGGYIEQFPAKQRRVRAIKSINSELKLNKELFNFAASLVA